MKPLLTALLLACCGAAAAAPSDEISLSLSLPLGGASSGFHLGDARLQLGWSEVAEDGSLRSREPAPRRELVLDLSGLAQVYAAAQKSAPAAPEKKSSTGRTVAIVVGVVAVTAIGLNALENKIDDEIRDSFE